MASIADYNRAAAEMRRPARIPAAGTLDAHELVRHATLAASSHNTQPWLFRIDGRDLSLRPDWSRRCPVVDPDDAHLYKSLGCAAENLVHAAAAQGHAAAVTFNDETDTLQVRLEPAPALQATDLFHAIPRRQCTRTPYDGSALTPAHLALLEQAGRHGCASTLLLTAREKFEPVIECVSRGNEAQLNDPGFRKELVSWIRFNPAEALRTGDGLSGVASGQPALPRWIARHLIGLVLTAKSQVETDARNIRSSGAIAVFIATRNDKAAWIDVGRACQRFALQAAALDLRGAFINQPIEVQALRPQLESWLGIGSAHALLMMRVGHAPPAPYSLRRPVAQVMLNT